MDEEIQQKAIFMDEATQKNLNTPLQDSTGSIDGKDQEFLNLILSLIEEGKIDLYKPSSLLNNDVYNTLNDKQKGEVDIAAMNMLNAIREIKGLNDNGFRDTFQMNNLVSKLRYNKEELESADGDVFII